MGRPLRMHPLDAALALVAIALLLGAAVSIFIKNPLRKSVLGEAERRWVEIVLENDSLFLMKRMMPGDVQRGEHGLPMAKLVSTERHQERLRSVWKVYARQWRGHLQFGPADLLPGEQVTILTPEYKFIGRILEIRNAPPS